MARTTAQTKLLHAWRNAMANRLLIRTTGTLHERLAPNTHRYCAQGCLIEIARQQGFIDGEWHGGTFHLDHRYLTETGNRIGGWLGPEQARYFGLAYTHAERIRHLNDNNRQDTDFSRVVDYIDRYVLKTKED